MVNVVFKHSKRKRFLYSTNPCAKIYNKTCEDVIEFSDCESKVYSISVNKKSIYETWLCYLIILIPFLYLWRFKVPHNPSSEAETVLMSLLIEFSAERDAYMELALHNYDDMSEIECSNCEGISTLRISKKSVSQKIKNRYAISHISNTLLWMVVTIVLLLITWNGIGALFAVLVDVGVSAYTIISILKQYKKK